MKLAGLYLALILIPWSLIFLLGALAFKAFGP